MVTASIVDKVVNRMKVMTQHLQSQVLKFVQSLEEPKMKGTPGRQLLKFAGSVASDDLCLMSKAIDEDCAQVDSDGW